MKLFINDILLGKLTSIMIVLLCFGYPISAILSLILNISSTKINGSFRAFILLLSILILSFYFIKDKCKLVFSKYAISLILFFFVYSIRLIWDLFIVSIYTEHSKFEICAFYFGNILFPIITVLFTFKFCTLNKLILSSFYILVIDNILIIVFYFFQSNWNFSAEILMERAQIKGSSDEFLLINPISFGIYGGYLILTTSTFLLFLKKLIPQKMSYLFFSLGLANLILSTSRGPFLFTLVGFVILLLLFISFSKRTYALWSKLLLFMVLIFSLIIFIITKLEQRGVDIGILQRVMTTKENFQSGEKEARNDLYSEGFNMFLESPIIGKQIVLESTSSYPHNIFIEVIMSTGIIGLCLYFITLIIILIRVIYFKSYSLNFIYFLSVFFLAYGISLTTGNIYQSVECWMFMVLILIFKERKSDFI
jgi:hypothetical protein